MQWKQAKRSDGRVYYYHSVTRETTYIKPAEFEEAPAVKAVDLVATDSATASAPTGTTGGAADQVPAAAVSSHAQPGLASAQPTHVGPSTAATASGEVAVVALLGTCRAWMGTIGHRVDGCGSVGENRVEVRGFVVW